MLRTGLWGKLAPGIYLTSPNADGRAVWMQRAWAGVLLGGDTARLAGLAAARLHGLVDEDPDPILVQIDHSVRRSDQGHWEFRRQRDGVAFRRPRGNPMRICVEDTVLDLIDGIDDPRNRGPAHWLSKAVQQRLTTPARLLAAVGNRQAIAQRSLITQILTDVADGSESALELHYAKDVERAHGLPPGKRQSVRRAGRFESTIRAFRDVLYEEYGLVVELDGRPSHVDEGRHRDLRRDNETTLRGERTLRYGWIDVTVEPCLTAFQVVGGLRLGGWAGAPTRCGNCRDVPESDLWEVLAV